MDFRIGAIGDYVVAFSLVGLLLYALQLLPNIVWLVTPPANDVLKHNRSPHAVLNPGRTGLRHCDGGPAHYRGQAGRDRGQEQRLAAGLRSRVPGWVLRRLGVVLPGQCFAVAAILGIAAMPPLYYFFVASWMKDYLALVPCVVFGTPPSRSPGQTMYVEPGLSREQPAGLQSSWLRQSAALSESGAQLRAQSFRSRDPVRFAAGRKALVAGNAALGRPPQQVPFANFG
jgi:hypothetical protein